MKQRFNGREIVYSKLMDAGYQVTCPCGTKTIMTNTDVTICRGCNHWLYRDKRAEFKYKLKENIYKKKKGSMR